MAMVPGKLQREAPLLVIAGGEGTGKSTLGGTMVQEFGGVIIQTEDGLQAFAELPEDQQPMAFPVLPEPTPEKPEKFLDSLYEAIDWCYDNMKAGEVLVLDTVSVMFQRMQQTILHRYGVTNVAAAAGGYGKGFMEIESEVMKFVDELQHLRKEKDVAVVVLSHLESGTLKNDPTIEAALIYQLAMDRKSAAVFRQQAFAILALMIETVVTGTEVDKKGAITKAGRIVKSSKRFMITDASTPAFSLLCKNRYKLPPKINMPEGSLDWLDNISWFN